MRALSLSNPLNVRCFLICVRPSHAAVRSSAYAFYLMQQQTCMLILHPGNCLWLTGQWSVNDTVRRMHLVEVP